MPSRVSPGRRFEIVLDGLVAVMSNRTVVDVVLLVFVREVVWNFGLAFERQMNAKTTVWPAAQDAHLVFPPNDRPIPIFPAIRQGTVLQLVKMAHKIEGPLAAGPQRKLVCDGCLVRLLEAWMATTRVRRAREPSPPLSHHMRGQRAIVGNLEHRYLDGSHR